MERYPLTAEGLERLKVELKTLSGHLRQEIIAAIAQARALGDLSENAEYHAAKEQQGLNEARIKELEAIIARAEVIDPAKLSGSRVMFGAIVDLVDEESDARHTYQIVGEIEADPSQGRLANTSPLARAILGREVGDTAEVKTPGGDRSYEILDVRYG